MNMISCLIVASAGICHNVSYFRFSALCICGIALFRSLVVLACLTSYFSLLLSFSFISLGLSGNISFIFSDFRHFLENLRHRALVLSDNFCKFNVSSACSQLSYLSFNMTQATFWTLSKSLCSSSVMLECQTTQLCSRTECRYNMKISDV